MRPYPTRDGIPISPIEMGFGGDQTRNRCNNHHSAWTRRAMSRLLITQTFRDLESMQHIIPRFQHERLHDIYDPPQLDLKSVYNYVVEAYEREEELRYGTAYDPVWQPFTKERLTLIHAEVSVAI